MRAKLVEGPEGELYFVPETGPSAEITGAVPETTTEPGSSLFAWADPILADPLGWAQTHLLSADILMPIIWQIGAIVIALLVGASLTARGKRLVGVGLSRLPESVQGAVSETAPNLVRPALWAASLFGAQATMAGAGMDSALVRIASSLSLAWLLINIVTAFLPSAFRKPAG